MKKTNMFGILALFAVSIIISMGAVSAYRGDITVNSPDCTEERHEVMEEAFETQNYESWYTLITENGRHSRVVEVVNEDNFETFIQAHEAKENGDYETAAALRAELGLGDGPKDGTGFRQGMGSGHGLKDGSGNGRGQMNNYGSGQGRM